MNHTRNPVLVSWGRQLRTEHGRCMVRQFIESKTLTHINNTILTH